MNSGFTPRTVAIVFLVALAFYFGGFHGLEYLRVRKGPWEVSFQPGSTQPGSTNGAAVAPAVVIDQPALGIQGVKIVFHGEQTTNHAGVVRFDGVKQEARFGEVIYEDLTFLPGVVTFNLFGHEIELVPRMLVVNRKTIPWHNGAVIDLWPSNKPAAPLPRPKGNRPDRASNAPAATLAR